MTRAALLAAFLRAELVRDFVWGRSDCMLFCADWIARVTGADPAADLRGTYATRAGAAHVIAAHGGLAALMRARLARLGAIIEAAEVAPCDVVLTTMIGAAGRPDPCGGIVVGPGHAIACRAPRGLFVAPGLKRGPGG
jgi:hypothetical protein